jgi:hypothetical protein
MTSPPIKGTSKSKLQKVPLVRPSSEANESPVAKLPRLETEQTGWKDDPIQILDYDQETIPSLSLPRRSRNMVVISDDDDEDESSYKEDTVMPTHQVIDLTKEESLSVQSETRQEEVQVIKTVSKPKSPDANNIPVCLGMINTYLFSVSPHLIEFDANLGPAWRLGDWFHVKSAFLPTGVENQIACYMYHQNDRCVRLFNPDWSAGSAAYNSFTFQSLANVLGLHQSTTST